MEFVDHDILITAPNRTRALVDGGENQMAARCLARRFWHLTERGSDVHFDALVATHGDADHIEGLSTLVLDAAGDKREGKRIRVTAGRVFHNGLCKRSSSVAKNEQLGPVRMTADGTVIPLVDDPRAVRDANKHFRRWATAIDQLDRRGRVDVRRLDHTSSDGFAFLDDVLVDVLAPRARELDVPGGSLDPRPTAPRRRAAEHVWDDDTLSPIELVDAIWREVPDFREAYELPEGLFRTHVPAYDETVVRELLVNAFVHRPYTSGATSSSTSTRIASRSSMPAASRWASPLRTSSTRAAAATMTSPASFTIGASWSAKAAASTSCTTAS